MFFSLLFFIIICGLLILHYQDYEKCINNKPFIKCNRYNTKQVKVKDINIQFKNDNNPSVIIIGNYYNKTGHTKSCNILDTHYNFNSRTSSIGKFEVDTLHYLLVKGNDCLTFEYQNQLVSQDIFIIILYSIAFIVVLFFEIKNKVREHQNNPQMVINIS